MAYCRFGWNDSDVYIYDDIELGLYCCACDLEGAIAGDDYDLMLRHIELHRAQGDTVPEFVDEELRDERDGNGWRRKVLDEGSGS